MLIGYDHTPGIVVLHVGQALFAMRFWRTVKPNRSIKSSLHEWQ